MSNQFVHCTMIENGTPIEDVILQGYRVQVKREDRCCPVYGAASGKIRGLISAIEGLRSRGMKELHYSGLRTDPFVRILPWVCEKVGVELTAEPCFASTCHVIRPNSIAEYCFEATYKEAKITLETHYHEKLAPKNIVVAIDSGATMSALIKTFKTSTTYWGVLVGTGDCRRIRGKIQKHTGLPIGDSFGVRLNLIDPGWRRSQRCNQDCPFPSHPWYDLKAWDWLRERIHVMRGSVLFWNTGAV